MINKILDELFDDSNIKEEKREGYIVMCEYFKVPVEKRTYKMKHYKKLLKKVDKLAKAEK